jgi:hypothetical protein
MAAETKVDPRGRRLRPTDEEIDAWAAREHARRGAWLAGPSDEEKRQWVRRFRWRAALGLEETTLHPAQAEVDQWAAREHQRRQAWLDGPSATEKQRWMAQQRRSSTPGEPSEASADADAEAWAARERQRRQQWLAGPTEEEKEQWAEHQMRDWLDELTRLTPLLDADLAQNAERVLREAELVAKGALYSLSRAPLSLWSYLVRAGEAFDADLSEPPRRRRVRY